MVALATSQDLAHLPAGECALLAALADLGIAATSAIWSSAETNWSMFGAVVVRSCWDYHLRVDEFERWIGHLHDQNIQVLNPPGLIRWNLDKRYLQELSRKGIAIPETIWLAPGEQLDVADACRAQGWQGAVVKPLVSATAHRTERKREGIVNGPLMIQEYLPAIEVEGEWSLMYFGGVFSHAVKKLPAEGDFRVQSDFGGTAELQTPTRKVLHAAEAAMSALPQPPVLARVDMVDLGAAVLLMELELIEPELFITLAPGASDRLAQAIRVTLR